MKPQQTCQPVLPVADIDFRGFRRERMLKWKDNDVKELQVIFVSDQAL